MTAPLAEQAVVRVLEERISDLTLGKNLFRGPARPPTKANGKSKIPERCVFALSTGGPEPIPCRENRAGYLLFCNVQVTIRSCLNEYAEGRELAEQVADALRAFPIVDEWPELTGSEPVESCPVYLGRDDGERHRWVTNLRVWIDKNVNGG